MPAAAPSLPEMMQRLIALPSVSSVLPEFDMGNRALIDELAGWLSAAGFDCEVMPCNEDGSKANLIASLGRGPGGLVLSGHTDTVPCDPGLWHHDPFRLTEADGRLYGLGTTDMKCFLALAAEAARGLRAADLRAPLIILATADEESSMCGAKRLVEQSRPVARYAVIGEPPGLRPVRMHKGIMMEGIRVIGRSGHSSDPRLGNNAMEGMTQVLDELLRLRADLQRRYRNPAFEVAVPTLNLGHIHGGDNPNRICGSCELAYDLRPLPGMDIDALRAEIRRRVEDRLRDSGLGLEFKALFEGVAAAETPADSELVRAAEALTGHAAGAVAFGTEAPYLQRLGMDVVVLGPGDLAQAHQPDEYLELARIDPTLELLRQLIGRFCRHG